MKIRIVCVGKIKEPYLRKGISFFQSKLAKKATVELIEVDDEKTPDNASAKEEEQIRQKEGERILRYLPDTAYVYTLCIDGKQMKTDDFRAKIEQLSKTGRQEYVFVIGGSLGLSKDVIRRADAKMSFSEMTFPHQMMRMILLEQLNRVMI
jgi:23S rRNA (pseudouridine1915-N3)-methyltransferase